MPGSDVAGGTPFDSGDSGEFFCMANFRPAQVPVEPPPTQAIAVLTGIPGRPYCLLDALVRAAELVLGDWRRRLAAQIARKLPKLTIRAGIKRPGEKQARWMFWAPAICRISPRAGRARRGEMVI